MAKEKVLAGLITFGIISIFAGWIAAMMIWPEFSMVLVAGVLLMFAGVVTFGIIYIIYNVALTVLIERKKK